GAGDGDLDRAVGMGAEKRDVPYLDGVGPADRANDARNRIRAPGAARGNAGVVNVESVERIRETIGVAFAPHLTIGQHIETEALLDVDRQARRVVLRFLKPALVHTPEVAHAEARRRYLAEPAAVDQPVGLRKAADDGSRKELA